MRWLLHGKLTPAAVEAMHRHKQQTRSMEESGLPPEASFDQVLETARKGQLEIITTEQDLSQAPFAEGARFGRTLVYLNVGEGEIEQDDAIDRLFSRYKRLSPGRLYTVTASRVKIRQLPGR